MPKEFALIPLRKRVNELSVFYGKYADMMKKELLSVDYQKFNTMKSFSVQKSIDSMIKELNRFVLRWSTSAVNDAYKEALFKSRVSLDILGAKRDKNFDKKIIEEIST